MAFVLLLTNCAQNTKEPDAGVEENKAADEAPIQKTSTAVFTLNNQKYTCDEVGAVGDKKENSITINAHSNAADETIFFSFVLKGITEGQKNFDAPGTSIEFTATETCTNRYQADCTNEEKFTTGTITITKLIDYSPEKDGRVEGNFEGQLSVKRAVTPYPCSNGVSANTKTVLVAVKGSFSGAYINTKEVPL